MARIVLVEDSPTDAQVYRTMLERHGHTVRSAENAEAGLTLVREWLPDLVLMDVVMPGANGFEATRALAKNPHTAAIPVLIVSSKGQPSDRVWGLRQGAVDYLVKPLAAPELNRAVDAALSAA